LVIANEHEHDPLVIVVATGAVLENQSIFGNVKLVYRLLGEERSKSGFRLFDVAESDASGRGRKEQSGREE